MFAPEGYTPLSMLWDQFIDAKIDAVYRSSANFYSSEGFDPKLIRGSALDITEHIFLSLMWKCWLHAASSDGQVMKIHSRIQDGVPGIFTQISPYRSAYDVEVTQSKCGHRDEIDQIAGHTFTEWDSDENNKVEWRERYPPLPSSEAKISDHHLSRMKFHTLPVCFERGRFMIVRKLPYWAQFVHNNRDQEVLVEHLGGRAIVVPDKSLEGWDKILSGESPVLEDELLRTVKENKFGRPAKQAKAYEAYRNLYPNGHTCGWKEVEAAVSSEVGESVHRQTIRRAIESIGEPDTDKDAQS